MLINTAARDSLNQQLVSLRDKTLWAFDPAQVKSLKLRIDKTQVALESTGPNAWRQAGKPAFRVRSDRVVQLLGAASGGPDQDFPRGSQGLEGRGPGPPGQNRSHPGDSQGRRNPVPGDHRDRSPKSMPVWGPRARLSG